MAESISQYPMVDKFLRYLQVEKNTSPLTVKNYAADISLFSNFLAERLGKDFQWQKIGVLDIRAYLALLNKEKYARTTIARRISSLRSFYKFLMRENYVEQNPFVKVRTPKLEKRYAGIKRSGDIRITLCHRLPCFRIGGTYGD